MSWQRYLRGISTLRIDAEACTGCGSCLEVCPHEVIELRDGTAEVADLDACMECGACARNCPSEAVTVESGVGCASAIVRAAVTGGEPACGCSKDGKKSGCC